MKTLAVSLFMLFISLSVMAQVEKSEVITLTARLNTTMALNMDQSRVIFEFNTLDEYKNGLGGAKGEYSSAGSISSTANWNLKFRALTDFMHTDGENQMPLDNVGLTAEFTGTTKVKVTATSAPMSLSKEKSDIIMHSEGGSNAGDFEDNTFIIYWEMGTRKATLNKTSILDQDLKKGEYNTQVEFIASEEI